MVNACDVLIRPHKRINSVLKKTRNSFEVSGVCSSHELGFIDLFRYFMLSCTTALLRLQSLVNLFVSGPVLFLTGFRAIVIFLVKLFPAYFALTHLSTKCSTALATFEDRPIHSLRRRFKMDSSQSPHSQARTGRPGPAQRLAKQRGKSRSKGKKKQQFFWKILKIKTNLS